MKEFVVNEVEPQALEYNEKEMFNMGLFKLDMFRNYWTTRKAGELCLLAPTVPEKYGGGGMDAVICLYIVSFKGGVGNNSRRVVNIWSCFWSSVFGYDWIEELKVAQSVLCVNNLNVNGSEEQKMRFLPPLCSGEKIGGICISEPDGGTDVGPAGSCSFR